MWPFSKKGRFRWPNGFGNKPCICECGHYLGDDEVKIMWESWCKVKCKKCSRKRTWADKYCD